MVCAEVTKTKSNGYGDQLSRFGGGQKGNTEHFTVAYLCPFTTDAIPNIHMCE